MPRPARLRSPKSDPQRAQVYRMERELTGAWNNHRAPADFLSEMSERAAKLYGLEPPSVRFVRMAGAIMGDSARGGFIRLNTSPGFWCGQNAISLLHELAHYVTDELAEEPHGHGPWFCGIYGWLLAKFRVLPPDAYAVMCRRWGIRRKRIEECSPRALRARHRRATNANASRL